MFRQSAPSRRGFTAVENSPLFSDSVRDYAPAAESNAPAWVRDTVAFAHWYAATGGGIAHVLEDVAAGAFTGNPELMGRGAENTRRAITGVVSAGHIRRSVGRDDRARHRSR